MVLGLSAGFALLAIAVYALKGHGFWVKAFALIAIVSVGVLSAIEIGLSLITGEGVNAAVFYHMKTGLGGGDVTQYAFPAVGAFISLAALIWVIAKVQSKLTGASERSLTWNAASYFWL